MKSKKFLSLVLALVMVFAMSATVLADGTNVPSAADTATVTITDVEAGATVKLYRIVAPVYNDAGLQGYTPVTTGSIADVTNPTAAEIASLAKSLAGTDATATASGSGTSYTATVGAGMYLVLVSGTGATVYNPMIVSVNYDTDSLPLGGSVGADGSFTYYAAVGEGDPTEVTAYAKKSTPSVDKSVVLPTGSDEDGNENGKSAAIGDTVSFQIETAIPSYSGQYTDPSFTITDTLSAGLTLSGTITVTVGETTVEASDTTFAFADGVTDGFTISFKPAFIIAHGGEDVVVSYAAEVNEDADLNFDPNTNTATVKFSNDPTDASKTGTVTDQTYVYTFAIDGNLSETGDYATYQTHELIKVKADGSVEVVSEETAKIDEIKVTNPLAGAVFTLTNTDTDVEYTATSDANGYLVGFTGLDAGSYTLVETTAPQGYVADPTVHTVVIDATYNADGTLASYSIKIDDKSTSTYNATYGNDGTITEIVAAGQPTIVIENSEIPALPSTGGIGTTLFYIIGAVLLVGAGVLLITRKRMSNNA